MTQIEHPWQPCSTAKTKPLAARSPRCYDRAHRNVGPASSPGPDPDRSSPVEWVGTLTRPVPTANRDAPATSATRGRATHSTLSCVDTTAVSVPRHSLVNMSSWASFGRLARYFLHVDLLPQDNSRALFGPCPSVRLRFVLHDARTRPSKFGPLSRARQRHAGVHRHWTTACSAARVSGPGGLRAIGTSGTLDSVSPLKAG
jgi:hypothetical protein